MAGELLLDTGALVSLPDRSQHRHASLVECFGGWSGEVVTTEAVLTEAIHLLGRIRGGPEACLDFVLSGGAILIISQTSTATGRKSIWDPYDVPQHGASGANSAFGGQHSPWRVCGVQQSASPRAAARAARSGFSP